MRPWFATRPHTEPGRPAGFIATVILPANSPVLRVEGQWQPRKKQTGAHACLEAIQQLHKVGYADLVGMQALRAGVSHDADSGICNDCSLRDHVRARALS